MQPGQRILGVVALFAVVTAAAGAEPAPSYIRQVKPFLGRYCLECHNSQDLKGGLNLETYRGMTAGGEHGPVLTPHKPDASRIVMLVEGKAKPHMPPRKARQPKPDEIAVLRAWVAAGARDDTATAKAIVISDVKPRVPTRAAITALAYRGDGQWLAVGSDREVILIDVASGDVLGRLLGQAGQVTALAFSPDRHWLAVASGESGRPGEVRLYNVPPSGLPTPAPVHVLRGHRDEVLGLAFQPHGSVLATCGYDRLVKLWDTTTGHELRTLKDHSDAVYGVAFSPDGSLLASGSADRAIKVWRTATGQRLYTLGQSTDWVYTVAWSPDGKRLAAAGVDRSLRIWRVSATSGQLSGAAFAHQGPVTRLVYAADGKTIYTVSEDRTIKAWDSTRLVERHVYPQQREAVLALAVRPDEKQLALGRYDGVVLLLDPATGKVVGQPVPPQPKPPQITGVVPRAGQRGKTVHVTLQGKHLDQVTAIGASRPEILIRLASAKRSPDQLHAELTIPANTPAGVYQLEAHNAAGQSAKMDFSVDAFTEVREQEPNDSATTGQPVVLPGTFVGRLDRAGDVDYYRFAAVAGQQIGVQVVKEARGSKLDPVLELTDHTGRILVESATGVLGYTVEHAGTYAIGIRDREYRGGQDMAYRLNVGNLPVVTSVFPMGLQRGTTTLLHVEGVNLGAAATEVRAQAPASAAVGSWLPVPLQTSLGPPLGHPRVMVGEFAEAVQSNAGAATMMPVPGTANGRIEAPSGNQIWQFTARRGQPLVVETHARRLGSPLDSFIEILDARGRLIPRATLRCVSKTFTTFRDHDSSGAGIRLESWNDLAMDDYLLVGTELMRIWQLPRNPDDDAQFYSRRGKRIGFLGTTPTYHSMGTPMYKVEIHPPGAQFPPNGLPVVTLYYQNDDGGAGFNKDSILFFDPPADGVYGVRVRDSRGQGGRAFGYRLTIRPPRPSFSVSVNPANPSVWKGGGVPITITADRTDGFAGRIDIHFQNLPHGLSAPDTFIPAGEERTTVALYGDAKAKLPVKTRPLRIVARAHIGDKEVVRDTSLGQPKLVEPGEIVTTTDQGEVTIHPGSQVAVTARIKRRQGFKGRVPLEVKGLPHGVHVLDVGLNGILITENNTSRAFVLYAEPWVRPMTHPIVVFAQHEGKGSEHAARSVLLHIERADSR